MSSAYRPPSFPAPIDLDLSRNEGRPRIRGVDFDAEEIGRLTSRYPDTAGLRDAIAARHGVTPGQLLVTAGGDDALFRCFLHVSGGTVVTTTPTFEMIRRYADQLGATLLEVPWWGDEFPLDEFLEDTAANPAMAVVVSPNNPTGNVLSPAHLRKLAGAYPLLVLDAAYEDFAEDDLTGTALELSNVVVVRTLSKALGLAGLRVGYLLGSESLVAEIAGYGSPYSVSGLSAALAEAVLGEAGNERVDQVVAERDALFGLLEELGARPLSSQANFVLATEVDAGWLVDAAASLGVGLRAFHDRPELSRSVRITVPGDEVLYRRLESTLRSALAPDAVLFDLDGVLVDVSRSYRVAIVETAAGFGVEVTPEDIAALKAAGNASDDWALTQALCARAGVEVALDEVVEEFERRYQGDGVGNGLKHRERLLVDPRLARGWADRMPLGVVTARPRDDAEEVLRRLGIADVVSTMVTREDAASKPDPAPVRLALGQLGVGAAWMLGDTPDDLVAARGAGVVPIGVLAEGNDPGALRAAARVLPSVNALEELLDATVC